ncbi:hypothetical protein RRG08_035437 [Elysia crispata]|uniref:Uncharacterized protein n=1 Tax=Elysia crispata TaxID=231223 RepID=A0AAE0Y420_9GAST|nr:hypothetical protein RRG08_035437 [Elysia crispata]
MSDQQTTDDFALSRPSGEPSPELAYGLHHQGGGGGLWRAVAGRVSGMLLRGSRRLALGLGTSHPEHPPDKTHDLQRLR